MKSVLLFAVTILFFCLSEAQTHTKTKRAIPQQFDIYISNAMKLWKTPGLSVVVVKDKQVVFKKGYGVTNLNDSSPFTSSTLSICASTTKAMTAVCMGMLVDEGKVKWTDKVSDIYPQLKLYDDYVNSELTVKDLLTHNAGLGNADWLWVMDYSLDTIIHQMRYIKPAYSFRSSFIYQNLMYMAAGEVIHKVSGKPWDEFIKERLFQPIGMNHTYPDYGESLNEPSHIAPHWMYDDSIVKPIPFIGSKSIDAAGGVWSCADDMSRWMTFLLDSAKVNGKRLLKPETFAALFTPQTMVTPSQFYPTAQVTKPHWTTYGLGWFQEDYKGKMVDFHTGSLDGAVAILGLIPDEDFGIYIFANMDHTEIRHALMYKAMDLWVFHDDKDDWSRRLYTLYTDIAAGYKKREKEAESKRVMNTKPSLPLQEYTGTFGNEIYGDAEIKLAGDSLVLSFPNHINVNLSHWNYDVFMGRYEHNWYGKDYLQFSMNLNGKIKDFSFAGMTYVKKENL